MLGGTYGEISVYSYFSQFFLHSGKRMFISSVLSIVVA